MKKKEYKKHNKKMGELYMLKKDGKPIKDSNGKKIYSGYIKIGNKTIKVVMFENAYKTTDNSPKYVLLAREDKNENDTTK